MCCAYLLGHVRLFTPPRTVAHQAPLSIGFSRQDYWSGLPLPPPGELPNLGIKPKSVPSPALAGRIFTSAPPGSPLEACTSVSMYSLFPHDILSFEYTPIKVFTLAIKQLLPGSNDLHMAKPIVLFVFFSNLTLLDFSKVTDMFVQSYFGFKNTIIFLFLFL